MTDQRTQNTADRPVYVPPGMVTVRLSRDDWRLILDALSCCAEKPIYQGTVKQLHSISEHIRQALQ